VAARFTAASLGKQMRDGSMKTPLRICAIAAPLLLCACVSIPSGPSVMALPGTGKSFDQFRADDAECRQYANYSVGGSSATEAQADSAVKSAAVGAAVGALAGAAIGGHDAAGAGAGTGLLFGVLAGSGAANASGYAVERRYDHAYIQCMYAKGNKVPTAGPMQYRAPRYYAPVAPAYYYPPPPPGYFSAPPPPQPGQ